MSQIVQSMMLLQLIVLFVLVAGGWADRWTVFGLAIYLGVGQAFHTATRLSLVPAELIAPTIPINSVIFQLALFIGPAIAGIIIVRFGVAWAFAVNIFSFGKFLLALSQVEIVRHERPAPRVGFGPAILAGFRYVADHPGIRPLLVALFVSTFTTRAVTELLPGFAAQVFDRGVDNIAWLRSMLGLGAVVGGMWMAQRSGVAGLTRMSVACIGTVASIILLFVATDYFPFALLALTGSGFAVLVTSTGIQTLVQSAVEGHIRGHMLSMFNFILQGSPALGSLAIGTVSEWLGLRWPLAIGAVFCFLTWLWILPQRCGIAAVMERAVVPAHN